MANILIIGSGITGVTTAYALLKRGHQVTVLDRRRYPGMETSYANGGQLSASNAEVWNSWSTLLRGLKWMLRRDAPLLLNPSPGLHKYSWLGEFCAQLLHHDRNTIETTRLAIAAREHLFRMAEQEKIAFDLKHAGILHLYYDEPSFRRAAKANDLLRQGGLHRHPVSHAEALAIEPAIERPFHAGYFTPSDSTGDIHKFTGGLAAACERMGARFHIGATVEDLRADDGSVRAAFTEEGQRARQTADADALVVCAGVASRRFAASLGDRVNIYPVKGYSITVELDDADSQQAAPTVSLLDEDAKIVTSRLGDNRMRIAGTAEVNGGNQDIRADRIAPLVAWSEALFPRMSTRRVVPWSGLRPMTPNMMPRIGQGRHHRVFYNTGHGHLGWTLSGATAELAAEQIDRRFGQA